MYEMSGGMEKSSAGGRGMTRREIMARVRAQVLLVRRLEEQLREMSGDGLRSLRLGCAGGGGNAAARGLDTRLEKKDALERMLERESAVLREYEMEARTEMEKMQPDQYAFCAMYYLSGLGITETAEMLERSERQCMRYRREIENESAEHETENEKM